MTSTPGRSCPASGALTVINNERTPEFVWKAGAIHRIRLINITPGEILSVTLRNSDGPVTWHPLTKDGAPVRRIAANPAPRRSSVPSARRTTSSFERHPGARRCGSR